MVNMIPDDRIKTVIDLSMGECGLLEKAKDRWPDARLYGADIDEELILSLLTSSVPDDSGRRESIIMESSTNEDCICSSIRMRLPIEDSILSIWIFTSWKEKEELSPVARPLT